ncbi:MAG: sugar-binding domain-containing protein [Thermincola sp.]|jgi:central glycolytic genes regulator|nr:sugar-binding domain-containing protein [Thermincola sp.]MDT3704713.1 sugar-binding domain-containing protein [Thermincola sp.]
MRDIISLQQKIVPELIELMERRYTILRYVSHSQPVGRRLLANGLKMGERIVRSELEFLKNQGLLGGDVSGVRLTDEGTLLVHELADFIKCMRGLADLEARLKEQLGLSQVVVVPGNSDEDELVKKELGRVAARCLLDNMQGASTVAVTGGTTVWEVAEAVPASNAPHHILFVPARGGLGEDVEIQANSIAAKIAKKLAATYRLLHVPDNIGEDAVKSLSKDLHIQEVITTIKSADILIHGIGNAGELSVNRGDAPETTRELMAAGAVGEAFGHYFAKDGTIVRTIHSLGVRLNDLKNIGHVIGVAGGQKKAAAIMAVMSNGFETVLITDEAAGKAILAIAK